MKFNRYLIAAAVTAACVQGAGAAPFPRATTPPAVDVGRADAVASAPQVTVTVALKLSNPDKLTALLQELYRPGSPIYRKFLTTAQFDEQFRPQPATLAQVTQALESAGLTVRQTTFSHLQATGSVAAIEAVFAVTLDTFVVGATADTPRYTYLAATTKPQVPAGIAAAVEGVFGLDQRPRFVPHYRTAPFQLPATQAAVQPAPGTVPGLPDPPGFFTVRDFATYYNVDPLYARGLTGTQQTIGIIMFAALTQSDAYNYWNSLGLKVAADRITEQQIDGGSGPPSDASGSKETTLDVEQSGGIAPQANIIVYETPNTPQGVVDAFAAAIDQNVANTLSASFGQWEFLDTVAQSGAVSLNEGSPTSVLQALNELFMQAAAQGQSLFAATGDTGAFSAAASFPVPPFTAPLSVADPAAQPYITATGGTTLAGRQTVTLPSGESFSVTVPTEQAWGWDYLLGICKAAGLDQAACGLFPGGGGGGVSTVFPLPPYQVGIAGLAVSEPGQELIDTSQTPPLLVARLPAGVAGRNLPDIALNSDPETGYTVYYTSDVTGFSILSSLGGTSFAAPQLNGVTALLDQGVGQRLGLLNYPLYNMLRSGSAYDGSKAPLRDMTSGDNWFYHGKPGYDQATGVGVPNVANLLEALEKPIF